MKIEFLEKIIGKIQHEIHCPKCKNVFAKGSLEICSVTNQRIEFSSYCHICGVSSQIVADINTQEQNGGVPNNQIIMPTKAVVHQHLNPEHIPQINKKLSDFSGKNVQELFQ